MADEIVEMRQFGAILNSLENGGLHTDLSNRQHELVKKLRLAAEEVGKAKGEIVLKLKYSADSGGTVQIDSEIAVKEPKPLRSRTVLWISKTDNLTARNPKQQLLPLQEVPVSREPMRDVGAANQDTRSV